jgi:hypothetical protein
MSPRLHLFCAATAGFVAFPLCMYSYIYWDAWRKIREQKREDGEKDGDIDGELGSAEDETPESFSTSLGFDQPMVIAMVGRRRRFVVPAYCPPLTFTPQPTRWACRRGANPTSARS